MTLSVAAYLVWFLVLLVALAAAARGGRALALLGALMAWGLVAATMGIEERVYVATSWQFLAFMALGAAGLVLFLRSMLRGREPRPR